MKTLECGCEQHQDTGQFMSLCHDHGQHMRIRASAALHPRAGEAREPASGIEQELIKILAPVVLSKWSTVTDPVSTAESLFQHVKEIMRRME